MKVLVIIGATALVLAGGYNGVRAESSPAKNEHCKQRTENVVVAAAQDHSGHMGPGIHGENHIKNDLSGSKGHNHGGGNDAKSWVDMSVHFIPMMQSVADMSQKVTVSMGKNMDDARMKALSEIMDELSSHLSEMSTMLFLGSATEQSMHELHMKINETAKKFGKI